MNMSVRWGAVAVAAALVSAGCNSSDSTGPRADFDRAFQEQQHALEDLPLAAASANRCSVLSFEPGRPPYSKRDSIPGGGGRPSSYQRFRFLRWDTEQEKPVVQASCVIGTDPESRIAAKAFFQNYGLSQDDLTGRGLTFVGTVNCFWYASDDSLECGGYHCINLAYMKPQQTDSVALPYTYGYECSNGCTVYDFSVYQCGGSPDPGDVEGGGQAAEPGDGTPDTPPADVTMELWSKLNKEEKRLCWESPSECWAVYYASTEALDRSKNLAIAQGATSIGDNKYDAMRHAFWNAIMIRELPYGRAETWATAHEYGIPMNGSKCMDLHNNEVGRTVGRNNLNKSYDELWEIIQNMAEASPPGLRTAPAGCP